MNTCSHGPDPPPRWLRSPRSAAGHRGDGQRGPTRSADTTTYTSASYLREVLSLPSKPKLVIESVTYDRFQWLLQQGAIRVPDR